jgi:hypothetical protein
VKSKKQAIAIGLSKAPKKGAKVLTKKSAKKKKSALRLAYCLASFENLTRSIARSTLRRSFEFLSRA